MRLRIDATDEAEFVSGVAERLAEWNWEVDREVTPDDGSARVDLLIRHGKCGPIGIEAKYLVDKAPARRVAEFGHAGEGCGTGWISGSFVLKERPACA